MGVSPRPREFGHGMEIHAVDTCYNSWWHKHHHSYGEYFNFLMVYSLQFLSSSLL